MEDFKVKRADLVREYNNGSEETREALIRMFGEEMFEYSYKDIKTYEDACKKLGIKEESFTFSEGGDKEAQKQAQALYKLLIIQKAINNGVWSNERNLSYFPYWFFFGKEEMECMSDESKQERGIKKLISCANSSLKENGGIIFEGVLNADNYSGSIFNHPIRYNSEEAALYAAKQFESIYFDYYGIKVKEEEHE